VRPEMTPDAVPFVVRNRPGRLVYATGLLLGIALAAWVVAELVLTSVSAGRAIVAFLVFGVVDGPLVFCAYRAFTARLVVADRGIEIRNVWRTRAFGWSAIEAFVVGADWRGPVMQVRLTSHAKVSVTAVATGVKSASQRHWLETTTEQLERVRQSYENPR
jgi:hypothetical protein